jgi:hypothetical protein
MKKNMGQLDRASRIVAALIIGYLYFSGTLPEATGLIFLILAVIFVITSFVGFCPLYLPFKMNTNKKQEKP